MKVNPALLSDFSAPYRQSICCLKCLRVFHDNTKGLIRYIY